MKDPAFGLRRGVLAWGARHDLTGRNYNFCDALHTSE